MRCCIIYNKFEIIFHSNTFMLPVCYGKIYGHKLENPVAINKISITRNFNQLISL